MKERFRYRAWKKFLQVLTNNSESNQIGLLEETDWDVCLVLDACRYDTLHNLGLWPVRKAISPASCTPEWIDELATSSAVKHSHIIAANPQYERLFESGDYDIERLWETAWDAEYSTVLPESVLDRIDELLTDSQGPIFAHLLQPHWPYMVKLGKAWKAAYPSNSPWETDRGTISSVQVAMERGVIDLELAKQCYIASVSSTWKVLEMYVSRWVDHNHSVVITSDHGETFGRVTELGLVEHPCKTHTRALTDVPWIHIQPTEGREDGDDSVESRLRALGYRA